jgi:D-sedoheptulose 7-phosphate isomerase
MQTVAQYFADLQDTLARLAQDSIAQLLHALRAAYHRGSRVYFVGNGGSAATAAHFVCDLTKNTACAGRPRFKAFALTDNVPLLTAWSNDTAYENVFAGQLSGLLEPNDVVVLISGSGRSPNILRAATTARAHGAVTVGLTGLGGSQLKDLVDICVMVPSNCMEVIEDVHAVVMHGLCLELRNRVRDTTVLSALAAR